MARFRCPTCGDGGDPTCDAATRGCPTCGAADVQFSIGVEEFDDRPLIAAKTTGLV